MIKSPLRFFLGAGLIAAILGTGLFYLQNNRIIPLPRYSPMAELEYARFLARTGQIETAMQEYKNIQQGDISDSVSSQAALEMLYLVNLQAQNPFFLISSKFTYFAWYTSSRFLALSLILLIVWCYLLIYKLFVKSPELAILPILDFSDQNLGDRLPQLILYRIKELSWKFEQLSSSRLLLSEALEVPALGMINDNGAFDISAILETALVFSGGPSNLPLSRVMDGLTVWFQQPKYFVRGELKKQDKDHVLHVYLLKRIDNSVEKSWTVTIKNQPQLDIPSEITDTFIYILLHHFGKDIQAAKWESLRALCAGMEKLWNATDETSNPEYLEQALFFFKRALGLDNNYLLSMYNLGWTLFKLGKYDEAREQFKKIALLARSQKLRDLSSYSYATSLLQLNQEWSYRQAIPLFTNLIDETDDLEIKEFAQVALALTHVKLAERDKEEQTTLLALARQEIQSMIKSKLMEVRSMAFAANGYIQMLNGNFQDAIEDFSRSVGEDSNNTSALIGLGNAYLHNGQKDDALKVFHQAEILTPYSGYASYKLGNIYLEMGEVEQAIQIYKRAVNFPLARLSIGKSYLAQGDYYEALQEFRTAAMQNKRLSDAWVNIAWTICEIGGDDIDLIKEAEDSARRALQLEKNPAQLWHRHSVLSRVYFLANKLPKAIAESQKAIELSPNQPQAYYYLAIAENKLGNKQHVEQIVRQVEELGDDQWIVKLKQLSAPI